MNIYKFIDALVCYWQQASSRYVHCTVQSANCTWPALFRCSRHQGANDGSCKREFSWGLGFPKPF